MANLLSGYAESGLTTAFFVRFRKSDGAWWNVSGTPAFESYASGHIADYGIAATETGLTGRYTATDPADTTLGDYLLVKAAGASLVVSDIAGGVRWQDTVIGSPMQAGATVVLTDGSLTAAKIAADTLAAIFAAVLKGDWSALTGEASYSLLNAARKLRNKWAINGTTLTIYKEDGSTASYTQSVGTTAGADPISSISN